MINTDKFEKKLNEYWETIPEENLPLVGEFLEPIISLEPIVQDHHYLIKPTIDFGTILDTIVVSLSGYQLNFESKANGYLKVDGFVVATDPNYSKLFEHAIDAKTLVSRLNKMWAKVEDPPTYKEFNEVYPASTMILRKREKENPEFGMARYGSDQEGISKIAFLATITDLLIGKRIGVKLEDGDEVNNPEDAKNKRIIGFNVFEEENQ